MGILSAPAGYGKSTLLSEWLEEQKNLSPGKTKIAWLSLDENDNDPVRFWVYLVEALRHSGYGDSVGQIFLDTQRSPQPPAWEQALVLLINELSALGGCLILILDDFQMITAPIILDGLTFFVEHLPNNLHLIIAGRKDPLLPLARYRAYGQVLEIHTRDLRFTRDEVIRFFEQFNHISLSPQDLTLLDQRLEGWVTGMLLTSLSLQDQNNRLNHLRDFQGDDRYILEFLTQEVLQHQETRVQHFLLVTSILDRFNVDLCQALMSVEADINQAQPIDVQSCGEIIQLLQQSNLFLVALDPQASWFRYHHLFARLLYEKLKNNISSTELSKLHARASHWLDMHGLKAEAIPHALASGDLNLAAQLVFDEVSELIEQAQAVTLLSWLKKFPEQFIKNDARLSLGYAWVYLYELKFSLANQWANQALLLAHNTPLDQVISAQCDAINATVAINQLEFRQSIQLSQRALQNLPPDRLLLKSLLFLNLGDANSLLGNFKEAIFSFENALTASRLNQNPMLEVLIIGSLGELYLRFGKLHLAEKTLTQVLEVERTTGGQPLLACAKAYIYLTRVYLEWNRLDDAKKYCDLALNYCKLWGHQQHLLDVYMVQAELLFATGEFEVCFQVLDQAERILAATKFRDPVLNNTEQIDKYFSRFECIRARFLLLRGDDKAAMIFIKNHQIDINRPMVMLFSQPLFLLAEYLLVLKQTDQARVLLERMIETALQNDWLPQLVMAQFLLSLVLKQNGEAQQSLACFKTCLKYALPENYCRVFIEKSSLTQDFINDLLADYKKRQIDSESLQQTSHDIVISFCQHLLQNIQVLEHNGNKVENTAITGAQKPQESYEVLSPREIEILHMVASGMNNEAIASALYLSNNTIKTHLKRIFARLGSSNRMEAVNRARDLKII
ncbi:MAG: LuxR C-terminal-related transcriptional regulator [Anaerolineae bacterium]|nr:LuxR C-terminal-related transcriptional regulator [Anaerolineae bacterium]